MRDTLSLFCVVCFSKYKTHTKEQYKMCSIFQVVFDLKLAENSKHAKRSNQLCASDKKLKCQRLHVKQLKNGSMKMSILAV